MSTGCSEAGQGRQGRDRAGEEERRRIQGPSKVDVVKVLLAVLTQLVLINSAELRELRGVFFVTFLIPAASLTAAAAHKAGTEYNSEVTKHKKAIKAAQEAGEDIPTQELQSPHIQVAVDSIAGVAKETGLGAQLQGELQEFWKGALGR